MSDRDRILFDKVRFEDDEKAFEHLYHAYHMQLCNYAFGFVRDYEDAQDLVNDCFFELWKNRYSLEIESSLKSWLYICVRNRSLNFLKKTKSGQRYISNIQYPYFFEEEIGSSIEKLLEQEQLEQKLKAAIEKLPRQCRYIFYLNRFEGMRYKAIAEKLNISEATVKTQIARALNNLRENFRNYRSFVLFYLGF